MCERGGERGRVGAFHYSDVVCVTKIVWSVYGRGR